MKKLPVLNSFIIPVILVFIITGCMKKEDSITPSLAPKAVKNSNQTVTKSTKVFKSAKSLIANGLSIAVGDTLEGGIVFYLDNSGTHGLVAALSDQNTAIVWGNAPFIIPNVTDITLGSGMSNTVSILTNQGPGNYAAGICDILNLNGFNDWYLPSLEELSFMYTNLFLHGLGGFLPQGYYWSSSEKSLNEAWEIWFENGKQNFDFKDKTYAVRAIRTF